MADYKTIGESWDTGGIITKKSNPKHEYNIYHKFLTEMSEHERLFYDGDSNDGDFTLEDFENYINEL